MTTSRPADLVISGQVVVAAGPGGFATAEAIAIRGGRVVAVGRRSDLVDGAPGAELLRFDDAAIVPGLHDFHLHLVGMVRARRTVDLTAARSMDDLLGMLAPAAARLKAGEWLEGAGWSSEALDRGQLNRLSNLLAGRPALLASHDHHSAWASPASLAMAGVADGTPDPPGGRLERRPDGNLDGVLRERAVDLVADHAPRLAGPALTEGLTHLASELAGLGITGATDAGDSSTANGVGQFAPLGESFSGLAEAATALAGRLRVNVDLPVDGLQVATALGLRSGSPLSTDGSMRVGWAKLYADGALGSRTAAVVEPYHCEGSVTTGNIGILRVPASELDELVSAAAAAGIGLAIHAIGDRAVATALDALRDRGPGHTAEAIRSVLPHRIEHAQLVRAEDLARFAELGITASLQPIHLPGDRDAAERCWGDRLADAYRWRSLASAGALLAFGSDAPIETANPWLGIHAAVRRTRPGEAPPAWGLSETLTPAYALAAYTLGPAVASRRTDQGHLRPGALADLAVLDVDLPTLLAADERLAEVKSRLTLVGGSKVHAE